MLRRRPTPRLAIAAGLVHAVAALGWAGCDQDGAVPSASPAASETGDPRGGEGATSPTADPAGDAPQTGPPGRAAEGASGEPTPPLRCEELEGAIPVFAGRVRGDHIHLGRLIRGPRPEAHLPELRIDSRVDVNDDGQDDFLVTPLSDGEPDLPGNRGERVQGLFVGCLPDAFAILIRPDYFTALEVLESTTTFEDRSWREVKQVLRVAADLEEEVDRMEAGEPLMADVIWWRAEGGYTSGRPFGGKWSDQCLHHLRQGRHEAARVACEEGLRQASGANERGALLYNLGRVSEAQGDAAVAADLYRRSLRARPGNATVRERLEALTPNAETP